MISVVNAKKGEKVAQIASYKCSVIFYLFKPSHLHLAATGSFRNWVEAVTA